jgi:hypothetical protein
MRLPNLRFIGIEDRSPDPRNAPYHPGLGDAQFWQRARPDITWNGPYDIVHPTIDSRHDFHVDSRQFAYKTVLNLARELSDLRKPIWIDIVMQGYRSESGIIEYPPVFDVFQA